MYYLSELNRSFIIISNKPQVQACNMQHGKSRGIYHRCDIRRVQISAMFHYPYQQLVNTTQAWTFLLRVYSRDLNNRLLWYSQHRHVSRMAHYSNCDLNSEQLVCYSDHEREAQHLKKKLSVNYSYDDLNNGLIVDCFNSGNI